MERAINRIYYGPPGTGKTYELQKLLDQYTPATSTETSEEWRQRFIRERIVGLKWWEVVAAAIHELGGPARVRRIEQHPFIEAKVRYLGREGSAIKQTIWGSLQGHTVQSSETVKTSHRTEPLVFDKSPESEWRLVGDWREACEPIVALVEAYKAGESDETVARSRHCFTTFHQSYGYEEFVEGIRPLMSDVSEDGDDGGQIRYEIREGVFKELCQRARLDPKHRYAMIIDEINRGNVSKIFGELITLIEPDKREGEVQEVHVRLPYSQSMFAVPRNVDIYGTMNTADRSLALIDTALRRRFEFQPLLPDTRDRPGSPLHGLFVEKDAKKIDIRRMLETMNKRIEVLYDRDHMIGHAYFCPLSDIEDDVERFNKLVEIFKHRIVPLLEEYFFEDWQKIRLVLGDNQKGKNFQFVTAGGDTSDMLVKLFGDGDELSLFGVKPAFSLDPNAFERADSYIGIYERIPVSAVMAANESASLTE